MLLLLSSTLLLSIFPMPNNQISINNVINVYLFCCAATASCSAWCCCSSLCYNNNSSSSITVCSSHFIVEIQNTTYFISFEMAGCGRKNKSLESTCSWVYCLCATKMTYYLTCLKLEHIFHLFFKHIHLTPAPTLRLQLRTQIGIVFLFNFD